jgi:outer membrane immunogenic protein
MKKLLMGTAMLLAAAGSASAADLGMPVKAPPPPPPPFSWTGFYLGVNIGGGWTNSSGSATVITPAGTAFAISGSTGTLSGVVGGGQIGYNWQFNQFVLGVEWDIDGSGERVTSNGGCTVVAIAGCTFNGSAGVNWFSTLRGRAGWAADRWLFYVTGGGAWQNVGANGSITTPGGTFGIFSTSTTRSGYSVGAGIEYAMWDHFVLGAEYLYLNTGSWNNSFVVGPLGVALGVPAGSVITTSVNNNNSIFRARLSYKF